MWLGQSMTRHDALCLHICRRVEVSVAYSAARSAIDVERAVPVVRMRTVDEDAIEIAVGQKPQEPRFNDVIGVNALKQAADHLDPGARNIEIEILRQLILGQDTEDRTTLR